MRINCLRKQCFYIYGGPEQLEELEALSNHYALLFNRKKAKLSSEQKSISDTKLKQVQQIFCLSSEYDGNGFELEKGKQVETRVGGTIDEMKNLHDSSVSKAAEMAAGEKKRGKVTIDEVVTSLLIMEEFWCIFVSFLFSIVFKNNILLVKLFISYLLKQSYVG